MIFKINIFHFKLQIKLIHNKLKQLKKMLNQNEIIFQSSNNNSNTNLNSCNINLKPDESKNRDSSKKRNKIINIQIYQSYLNRKNNNLNNKYTNQYIKFKTVRKRTTESGTQTESNNNFNDFALYKNNLYKNDSNFFQKRYNNKKNKTSKTIEFYNISKNDRKKSYDNKIQYSNFLRNKNKSKNTSRNKDINNNNKKLNLQNKINNHSYKDLDVFDILSTHKKCYNKNNEIRNENKINFNNTDNERNKISKKVRLFNIGNNESNIDNNTLNSNDNYNYFNESNKNQLNSTKNDELSNNNIEYNTCRYDHRFTFANYHKNSLDHIKNNATMTKCSLFKNCNIINKFNYYNGYLSQYISKIDTKRKDYNKYITNKTNTSSSIKIVKGLEGLHVDNYKEISINNNNQNDDVIKENNNDLIQNDSDKFYNNLIKNINNNIGKRVLRNAKNNQMIDNKNNNNSLENSQIKYANTNNDDNNSIDKFANTNIDDNSFNKFIRDNKNQNDDIDKKTSTIFQEDIPKDEIESGEICCENLYNTYDESEKEINNQSNLQIEKQNNNKIADEKSFYNKIPKIEEIDIHSRPSDQSSQVNNYCNNYNNINPFTKNNKNLFNYDYEFQLINKLSNKQKNKAINENTNNIPQQKTNKPNNENKINQFNPYKIKKEIENLKKMSNKVRMYNYLFNDENNMLTSANSKTLRYLEMVDRNSRLNRDNVSKVDNMINQLCEEIKINSNNLKCGNSCDAKYFSRFIKGDKNKNSYSKYYLNKLEVENNYLIPQLKIQNKEYLY